MSHGNGCSTFVFQVMGILKPCTVSSDKGLQLSHSLMVGCNLLYGSNFDFHMTYFASRPRPVNLDHASPWLCPRIGKWTPTLIDCCGTNSNSSRQIDSWPRQVPFMLKCMAPFKVIVKFSYSGAPFHTNSNDGAKDHF